MIPSKAWNWKDVAPGDWTEPCEESFYLAARWEAAGIRRILDLGCGRGRHSVFFASKGFQVTAVDLSDDAVAETKAWTAREELPVRCICADMGRLPFSDGEYDAIFSYHVISHTDTEGMHRLLSELRRVLRPGGKVFLTLCSKQHRAYTDKENTRVDENTLKKTEGAEVDVPHFFADGPMLAGLFSGYRLTGVRHICECGPDGSERKPKCHYYIEGERRDDY